MHQDDPAADATSDGSEVASLVVRKFHSAAVGVGSLLEFARFEMALIAAEGDTVVAVGDQEYTVTSTGTVVTGRLAHVYTFSSDGKVARFEEFEPGGDGAW